MKDVRLIDLGILSVKEAKSKIDKFQKEELFEACRDIFDQDDGDFETGISLMMYVINKLERIYENE